QPIGDTPHRVPGGAPNVLTGITIGKTPTRHDCGWWYGTLTLIKTAKQDEPVGEGDLAARITDLEGRFNGLITVLIGDETETFWEDSKDAHTKARFGRVPRGEVMTGIWWEAALYSKKLGLQWPAR